MFRSGATLVVLRSVIGFEKFFPADIQKDNISIIEEICCFIIFTILFTFISQTYLIF